MRTGSFWGVEGKHVWCRVLIGDAGNGVHQSLGEVLTFCSAFFDNHHHAVAQFHRRGHTLADAFLVAFLHHELVNHRLDVMVLVSVDFHTSFYLPDFAVDAHVEIALAAQSLEEFTIVTLAHAHEWGEEEDGLALVFIEDKVDDLLFRIFHHLLAALVAVGRSGTCEEQAQVIVNLGGGAHGGARVLVGGLLLDADHRAQACNLIYVRALHVAQKIAGVS